MGNYLGLAKLASINRSNKLCKKNLLLSIIVPILVHTIYDYCLFTSNLIFLLFFIIFLIFIYTYSIKKIKLLSSNNKCFDNKLIVIDSRQYCPRCGSTGTGSYCTRCGTKLEYPKINGSNNLTH